jgi:hypothetical protein
MSTIRLVALLVLLSCIVTRTSFALAHEGNGEKDAAAQINLIDNALKATTDVTNERELQVSMSMCRCQAYFEDFYADRRRRLQNSYPYDYSDSYQDDDGYFVVEDIKVLNCRGNGPVRASTVRNRGTDGLRGVTRGIFTNNGGRKLKNGLDNSTNVVLASTEVQRELGKGGKGGKGYYYSGKGGKGGKGMSKGGGKGMSKGGKGKSQHVFNDCDILVFVNLLFFGR